MATDCEVPVEMPLQALAHANGGNNNMRLVRGADDVGICLFCEVMKLGYVFVCELGLENMYAVRCEDSLLGFGTSWRVWDWTRS